MIVENSKSFDETNVLGVDVLQFFPSFHDHALFVLNEDDIFENFDVEILVILMQITLILYHEMGVTHIHCHVLHLNIFNFGQIQRLVIFINYLDFMKRSIFFNFDFFFRHNFGFLFSLHFWVKRCWNSNLLLGFIERWLIICNCHWDYGNG